MKKVKRIVAFVLCTILLLALSVSAFADSPTVYATNEENYYGLYDGKYLQLAKHTDVIVRKTAGGDKWPSYGTLWSGYYLTVDKANCNYVNSLYWSKITPDNDVNPTYVNSGYSASYLLS